MYLMKGSCPHAHEQSLNFISRAPELYMLTAASLLGRED
jgi:hypothetical protein